MAAGKHTNISSLKVLIIVIFVSFIGPSQLDIVAFARYLSPDTLFAFRPSQVAFNFSISTSPAAREGLFSRRNKRAIFSDLRIGWVHF